MANPVHAGEFMCLCWVGNASVFPGRAGGGVWEEGGLDLFVQVAIRMDCNITFLYMCELSKPLQLCAYKIKYIFQYILLCFTHLMAYLSAFFLVIYQRCNGFRFRDRLLFYWSLQPVAPFYDWNSASEINIVRKENRNKTTTEVFPPSVTHQEPDALQWSGLMTSNPLSCQEDRPAFCAEDGGL